MGITRTIARGINTCLSPLGMALVRTYELQQPAGEGLAYVGAEQTVAAAKQAGLSVTDYVERLWKQEGNADKILADMARLGVFDRPVGRVLEVGAGTGMYVDKVLKKCGPVPYESYEIAADWADWLAKEYKVISHPADGKTLGQTPDGTIDLVHGHGVFVYLRFLACLTYFQEMLRVARPGGYLVFDIMSEDCWDDETVEKWLAAGMRYPCFLSKDYVKRYVTRRGGDFVGDFLNVKFGPGKSEYLVFRRR